MEYGLDLMYSIGSLFMYMQVIALNNKESCKYMYSLYIILKENFHVCLFVI